jgi:hypothetical protein
MDTMPHQHNDGDERLAGDLLIGAKAIRDFLVWLGLPEETSEEDVYYFRRAKKWPIGSDGAKLAASKRRLARYAQKITAPAS